ncbi:MAG TPA: exonuclease domain-containing protein, partial [Steroidobacteraceae bacterium]
MVAAESLPEDLVFVDLETTGGNSAIDRITEVGIIRVRDGELIDEWSSLVNPECSIPAYIEAFTGISNEMVAAAPRFAAIAALVRQKLHGAVFVAHNARFDYSFLRSEFHKSEISFSAPLLCTVKLSRRLFPGYVRHNLDAVMERNGLTCSARHRALGDAQVLCDFWFKLRRELPVARLAAAVHALLGAQAVPAHLAGFVDDLPEGPGAYRLFGDDNVLLYVGKGPSLRARVCSHLAAGDAHPKERRLADQVRRIDWQASAGELGAMLREAQWIKNEKPLYNRRARHNARSYTLCAGKTQPLEARAIDAVERADLSHCYGVFHTEKDARKALSDIARAHHLCQKVLGFEVGAGSCVAFQVGKCKGACVAKEPIVLHNMRLHMALAALKFKTWPFPGRIALRERARYGSELHVIDHWAYLGTARSEEEVATLAAGAGCDAFDVDVYKILVRHFARNPRLDWLDLRRSVAADTFDCRAAYNA